MEIDFDALSKETKKNQSREAMDALWGATYDLKEWHFAARGEMPSVRPFIGIVDEKPFIFAFTDSDRVGNFCKKQGLTDQKERMQILSMAVTGFVNSIQLYSSQGVYGILFNDGPEGYYAPLTNLMPMLHYFQEKKTNEIATSDTFSLPDNFNNIVKSVLLLEDESALFTIYDYIFRLPLWYFISDKEQPNKPQLWPFENSEVCILAFTSEREAVQCAKNLKLVNSDGSCSVLMMPVDKAVAWMKGFPAIGIHRAIFNAVGQSQTFPLKLSSIPQIYSAITRKEKEDN